jgi:hypothetical protein
MPITKKGKTAPKHKACGPKKCGSNCKSSKHDNFDGFLADFTANKTTVLILMAAVLGVGAMFSLMLGVSAASF